MHLTINANLLKNKATKFLSPDIQNEIIRILGRGVLRLLTQRIREELVGQSNMQYVFGIICDGTRDIQRREQESICLRFCNEDLEAEEVFLGYHETSHTDAESLKALVKDYLLALNIDFANARGQAYDGASNMAGIHGGLQRLVRNENTRALYCYCAGHSPNLITMEGIQAVPCVAAAMARLNDAINFVRSSAKRLELFRQVSPPGASLRPMCPTRWVLRLPAVDQFLTAYQHCHLYLV